MAMNHVSASGFARTLVVLTAVNATLVSAATAKPLSLHPENPHYFLFRGKPTVLITSAEHYGAVLNLDFDYVKYLDTLAKDGLNNTRTFTGSYVEPQGAFNIARNTLAPGPNRFICPWARSDTPGYANSGNKFDLTQWDGAYFKRLRDFVAQAGERGVVVEMNLFCPFYEESQWKLSPQNAINNINGIGTVGRTNVYTLDKHGGLLAVHEAMVRKIVTELNGFDNLYYELCNEPYFGGVTIEWQHHIADVIVEAEKNLPNKHLISQNIANGKAKIEKPHPAISIFNFHYAQPPDTVPLNYALNKAIGDNETGFRGTNDLPYRVEAWEFILSGGALYNNLDYSFVAGHEDGAFVYPATQPGGGNPAFRKQIKVLKDFIHGFDIVRMKPLPSVVTNRAFAGAASHILAESGRAYAVYLGPPIQHKDEYSVRWTGKVEPKFSETYTFYTFSNDGVRLWVDGKLVVDDWTAHSGKEDSGAIALEAGRKYGVKIEYYQGAGGAAMKLFWSSPSQAKEVVPNARLFMPDSIGRGLQGEYFEGKNFDSLRMTRTDGTIDFEWTNNAPFGGDKGKDVARSGVISLELPSGTYLAEWVDTLNGKVDKRETRKHKGGALILSSPPYREDIALKVLRKGR
jgi:PA14 domain-containing protein